MKIFAGNKDNVFKTGPDGLPKPTGLTVERTQSDRGPELLSFSLFSNENLCVSLCNSGPMYLKYVMVGAEKRLRVPLAR